VILVIEAPALAEYQTTGRRYLCQHRSCLVAKRWPKTKWRMTA